MKTKGRQPGTEGRGDGQRIGVALAGGGPIGGIYEVGALAALSEALDGVDLNDVEFFVGVSSGSFVAAALANGMRPMTLARMLVDHEADAVFDPDILLRPAFAEYGKRLLSLPPLIWSTFCHYLADPWHLGLGESLQNLGHALPAGVLDNSGIDLLLRALFSAPGRSNDFRALKSRLFLIATDLDSGDSVPFGSHGYDDVPISLAVQASAALPGLYPPVEIGGRHYVDGALIKTLHASVALHAGATLLLCINPLVPFSAASGAGAKGAPTKRLVDGGLPVVLTQTFRAIIHSRMRTGMQRYRHEFPKADIMLFEPASNDAEMFFTNVFSYASRRHLCEHAYQRTRADLYRRRDELAPVFARHGISLRLDVLRNRRLSLLDGRFSRGFAGSVEKLGATLEGLDAWLSQQSP